MVIIVLLCTQLKGTLVVGAVSHSSSTIVAATRAPRSVAITLRGYRKREVCTFVHEYVTVCVHMYGKLHLINARTDKSDNVKV